MAIPNFITTEFFEKVLRAYLSDENVVVADCSSSLAIPIGDHYGSSLTRSRIKYQTSDKKWNTTSVLVKTLPQDKEVANQMIKEMKLFEKEIHMFSNVLPGVHKILDNLGTISAKCFYTEEIPIPVIVLEDLSPLGFNMLDRRSGLDLEHCLLVTKKIAQLHAASLVIHEKDPTAFEKYDVTLFSGNPLSFYWVKVGIECIIRTCKQHSNMVDYIEKLEKIKNIIEEKCKENVQIGPFCVLNHGDCWNNNFMFQYDPNGKLLDIRLVDYQLGIYASPAVDLQYFWATTPNIEVRRKHLDTFLNYYYDELVLTLTKIDYSVSKVPTRVEFKKDWYCKGYYGFAGAVTVLPLTKCDLRNDSSLEALLAPLSDAEDYENSFRYHAYNNPAIWQYLEHALPFFDSLGIFNN